MAARRGLARRGGGRDETGPRQEGGIFGRDEDMFLRSKSKCPNEVDRGIFGDKVVSKVGDAANETLFEGTTKGGERRRAKGAMPVGNEASCRQRLKREKGRRAR